MDATLITALCYKIFLISTCNRGIDVTTSSTSPSTSRTCILHVFVSAYLWFSRPHRFSKKAERIAVCMSTYGGIVAFRHRRQLLHWWPACFGPPSLLSIASVGMKITPVRDLQSLLAGEATPAEGCYRAGESRGTYTCSVSIWPDFSQALEI